MAEGREREAWDHTAKVCEVLANTFRDPKAKAANMRDFHPYEIRARLRKQKTQAKPKPLPVAVLKGFFVRD
jgi:hypothetical protein